MEDQILKELHNNRYQIVDNKPALISALGAIPKSGTREVRLIHDCSRPAGASLNDFAHNDKFHYQSIQDAVDIISPNCYLAKLDLANAYRSVRIHPSNYIATGLKWYFGNDISPSYMVDTRLPFGARCSPEIFHELGQAVCRIMCAKGHSGVIVYLDDFLVVGRTKAECLQTQTVLRLLLRKLGFAINYSKLVGPCQQLTFLGIVLDTVSMTLELPSAKIAELREALTSLCAKQKATKRQLQSLLGRLNWACQCIVGGRIYLRRIIDAIARLRAPWHRTRVTKTITADIDWWLSFLDIFNGFTKMIDHRPVVPVYIDLCQVAAGAYFDGDMAYTPWSCWPAVVDKHINHKEALTLETAVCKWAPLWKDRKVFVFCDNLCAVSVLNKGLSKDPVVMDSIRRTFWWSMCYNFKIHAFYLPGKHNTLADAISRLHEQNGYERLLTLMRQLNTPMDTV